MKFERVGRGGDLKFQGVERWRERGSGGLLDRRLAFGELLGWVSCI